ncbi:MAG: hypothetical protein M3157_07325 [Actinomycetota bacterium]|nr:hypothetical protein [Actinomycetota bacterium]
MSACGIRVMSFNVRGASHEDGINVWGERAAMNVETIRRYGPDIIGFQEVQSENLEVYERELPGYARLPGPVYGAGRIEEYAAIFSIRRGPRWLTRAGSGSARRRRSTRGAGRRR